MTAPTSHVPVIEEARDVVHRLLGKRRPECPICKTRFTPTDPGQPYVVGPTGEVYCRKHGETVLPGYRRQLEEYNQRRKARKELLARLDAEAPLPAEAEVWAREQIERLDLDDKGWRR